MICLTFMGEEVFVKKYLSQIFIEKQIKKKLKDAINK